LAINPERDMNTLICDAIRARRLIRFVYDGYERVAEPHLYGISTANHEVLSAYLVGGWSKSEGAPGWRKYLVRDMHDVQALAESFAGPRDGYNPEDRQVRQIYCRLESATRPAAEAPQPETTA
jgi:hypothetical protein